MSNNIYAFVIQSKKGENMMVVPNNNFRIDLALYLADRIYDKVLIQFKLKQKVDRHFVVDHNIAGIIYITDHFIFHLFINSSYINVGNDFIKKLVNAFNINKMIDAACLEKKFFEVYFILNSGLYQKFIDHRQFNFSTKNLPMKQAIEDKLCDKELGKIRFSSMQSQQAGSTLSSKIAEEKEAISFIPYRYAKRNYNQTKVNQFLQSFNSKIEIQTSIYKQTNNQQCKEMIRNKLYQYAFQMKVKNNSIQNEVPRQAYPLNRNNIKNIQKIKPQIQSFSSKEMQLLQQKYGGNINPQIIQENIENKCNDIIVNGKNKNSTFNESPIKARKGDIIIGSPPINENKRQNNKDNFNNSNQVNPPHVLEQNGNQEQNKENDLFQNHINNIGQIQQKPQFQQQDQQVPNSLFAQQNKEDLIDFDFNVNLQENNAEHKNNYQNNNEQKQFFSNPQPNNFNHFQQQQQQVIDLI